MMTGTKADFEWYAKWSKEDLQAHLAFMNAFNKELKDSGTFVAAEGLAFPDQAKIIRAGKNREPITDGVFPEAKEFLAGYWNRIAARASASPHPPRHGTGGTSKNQPIEVRQVMSGPPEELLR
jgi:hypothetical protein